MQSQWPASALIPSAGPRPARCHRQTVVPSGEPARVNTPDGWTLALGAKDESATSRCAVDHRVSLANILQRDFCRFADGPEAPAAPGGGLRDRLWNRHEHVQGVTIAVPPGSPLARRTQLPLVRCADRRSAGDFYTGPRPARRWAQARPHHRGAGGQKRVQSSNPWIMVHDFHVKIDGCVGQSFIRSYATLTSLTDQSDVVLSYIGITKAV